MIRPRLALSLLLSTMLVGPLHADDPPGTVTIASITDRIEVDGALNEPIWQTISPITGFRQVEPESGAPAGLATEVRLAHDDRFLYVAAIMHDTTGADGVRVPDLRRDFSWGANDLFGIVLDSFGDARTAVSFQVTPEGTLRDLQVANGDEINIEWNAVWTARTRVTDAGWTAELAIPWATLRYPDREAPTWRVNFVRRVRRTNEIHSWQPYPRALTPYYTEYAGTLDGLRPPPPSRNVLAQPYLTVQRDQVGGEEEITPDIGGELKWAITPSTVLDLTVNTDFAQADADRQVIDLSRFSVFFPERRAFFLENAELFDMGTTFVMLPFFSRRIGLSGGQPIPIDGGARFVSRTATRSAGGLAMRQQRQGPSPAAWFGVGRYVQNVGSRGRLGGLVTLRQNEALSDQEAVTNATFTVDGYVRPTDSFETTWFVSRSETSGAPGNGWSGYAWLRNNADWGYLGHVQGLITDGYRADVGFVSRPDLIVTSPAVSLDLRPDWLPSAVRSWRPGFTAFLFHEYSTRRFQEGSVSIRPLWLELNSGAEVSPFVRVAWQRLTEAEAQGFRPLGLEIAPGDYTFTQAGFYLATDQSRKYAATFEGRAGPYFDGSLATFQATTQVAPSPRVALRVDYTFNQIRSVGPDEAGATSHLLGPELRLALNPRVQASAFYQYNTFAEQGAWNVRFAWEFSPLSFVYLVFNDRRFYVDDLERRDDPFRFQDEQQVIFKVSYLRQL